MTTVYRCKILSLHEYNDFNIELWYSCIDKSVYQNWGLVSYGKWNQYTLITDTNISLYLK